MAAGDCSEFENDSDVDDEDLFDDIQDSDDDQDPSDSDQDPSGGEGESYVEINLDDPVDAHSLLDSGYSSD
jgi:hypothetical protein